MSLLDSQRLYLEEADIQHLDAWYDAMKDGYAEAVKWLHWPERMPDKEEVGRELLSWEVDAQSAHKRRFFIFTKENNQLIGMIGFGKRPDPDEVYVFYYVRGSQRKKGYMKEMIKQFINWIHSHWNIPCVVVKAEADNIASATIVRGL